MHRYLLREVRLALRLMLRNLLVKACGVVLLCLLCSGNSGPGGGTDRLREPRVVIHVDADDVREDLSVRQCKPRRPYLGRFGGVGARGFERAAPQDDEAGLPAHGARVAIDDSARPQRQLWW